MSPEPTPARPVSRRGLRIAGLRGAAGAVIIVVTGITTRKMADARLSEWTEHQAVPVVAVAAPDTRGKRTTIDLPGRLEAYSQAQIYARVSGYLKEWKADIGTPVKAGPASRRDRRARPRPADHAGAGRCRQRARQRQPFQCDAAAWAIAGPVGRGVETGSRPKIGRFRQQAGPGQIGAGQSRPPARAGEIQAHRRAVRRPGHRAHHRRRRADQRGAAAGRRCSWSRTPAQAARLRQRAAELRAQHQDRHQGANLGSGISGTDVFGDRGSLGAVRRRRVRHDAHAARRRQCQAAN